MHNFAVEAWHLMAVFATIVIGIFKQDISLTVTAYMTVSAQKHLLGQTIEIQSPTGDWEQVTLVEFRVPVPFIKRGGVFVEHQVNGNRLTEKITYDAWHHLRIRF